MPKVQEGTFMNQLRDENEEIQKLKRQILAKERIIENQREQIKHLFMNKETAHLDYINENQEDNYRKQYEYIISYYKEFNNEFNSLKNIRLYLNSLLRNVEDIIYRLDPQGCICYVNDKVLQYGYEKDELMGMNILELIHPDDRDSVKYNVRERRT
ncbi:MAG: PAS domain S-box protein, partial [Calditrichaceae bacterium]